MKKIIFLFFFGLFSLSIQSQENNPPIHVKVTGSGAPILLIPGFTVPGESWDTTVRQLEKNHECHVVTLAGFGGKKPIAFPWLPKVNEALIEYIKNNNLHNLTIMGHSLGGTIATLLASKDSLDISKIILIDALPAAGAMIFPDFNPDNLVYDSPFNNQQLTLDDDAFALLATNMASGMSLNKRAQENIKAWIIAADRKTYVYGYTDYLKMDLREALKDISIPVTILAADRPYGKEMTTQTYQSQYANLANYNLIIAENAAHFIMFDNPDWFMKQIQNILSSK